MNFDSEVGKTLTMIVNSYSPKDGSEKIGFEPKFNDFDVLIYNAIRSTKTQRELDKEADDLAWDMVDDMVYGSRAYGRQHRLGQDASMHIFHLSGYDNPKLTVGDAWEVEVVKCYAATRSIKRDGKLDDIEWTEPKTRDGRTKIHFTVKPLKRLLVVTRSVDWSTKRLCIDSSCGNNQSDEFVPLDKVVAGTLRHTDARGSNWVVFGRAAYLNGKVAGVIAHGVQSCNGWMNDENTRLGGRIETRRLKALWRELPEAPTALWDECMQGGLVRQH